jgi:hypothetical protein
MAFTDTPKLGVDLAAVIPAADVDTRGHKLGSQVFASDGKRYVYAQANATITASTAVANINTTTFLVAASGGGYLSPATAMSSGDQGWFSKASV